MLPLVQTHNCTIHLQIYWLGPILGAVIAGFFYEFIFNPTRESSLCYRPKLFRFSAHDMAKVGSKSRLYQQQQQQKLPNLPASSTIYRPQAYNQTIQHIQHHSPSPRAISSNLINSSSLLKSSRNSQLIPPSTSSITHIQPSHPTTNNFDQMGYLQQQHQDHHQQQVKQYPHTANIDRSKSAAIINTLAAKQHQNTINISQRNNADLGKLAVSSYLNDSALYSNGGAASFSEL